ncbi:hypothetical protein EVAR_65188_1 [Eumeta japonica]|uniref:Uncharacterized protein n=1 Tax=Eumeta variegata TaxID=151549 RepID=A0A4C1ZLS7_EUMVA|nr:hypothetical protein EVAR_65188_1 [Eumeta japonica]
MKGVALKLNCIEPPVSQLDYRPVLMRLGSLTQDCPPAVKTISNWRKVSTVLEEIDTPILNNNPNDIVSTDDIDIAIGALTNHITTVVDDSSDSSGELRCQELPRHVKVLIRAKTLRCAERANTPHVRIGKVRHRVSLLPKDDLDPITQDEVIKHSKALKMSKTPGVDTISSKALKPNHSWLQQALRLVEYISEGFKVKRKTVAVFFDVAMAFDRDASEHFFDVASNHPNPLLVEAVSYEPPPPHYFCRRPRNILIDPPDDLTVEMEKLIELNKMVTTWNRD